MGSEYFETQINAEMDEVEVLVFDSAEAAIYSNKKPIPQMKNEDALGLFVLTDATVVAAVADGMGGHKGAAQASAMAIETLEAHLKSFSGSEFDLRGAIFDAIELAQIEIQKLRIGAGTTLTIATRTAAGLRVYNIGDSAAIHLNRLAATKYRSFEHSVGGMQFVTGQINEREVGSRDDHQQLINFLGSDQMKVEVSGLRAWKEGDMALLGSDGLFDNIVASELYQILSSEMEVAQRLKILIDMANDNMLHGNFRRPKPDDLTAILFI